MITIDIETKDPLLKEMGPGTFRKDGYVIGVSVKHDESPARYLPIRHPETTEYERNKNKEFLRDFLGTKEPKLLANALYDLEWLEVGEGICVNGPVHDIQIAEPLLNENAESYSVDTLASKYLKKSKKIDRIKQICEERGWKGVPQTHLWRLPSGLVGPYCSEDVEITYEVFKKQMPSIHAEELTYVYDMERGLIPLLLMMRKNGVRIDRNKRKEAADTLSTRFLSIQEKLFNEYGAFNINSTADIVDIFNSLGLRHDITEKGNPSVTKETLERTDHIFAKELLALKETYNVYNTFVMGAFTEHDINERIHCSFLPLKQDEGGTVSGRFSSRHPNLQQVPKRDDEEKGAFDFEQLIRSIFIADEGCWFGHIDYSQIEYRVIAHYARGPKSDDIREQYNKNPKTDYHKLVMDWMREYGKEVSRGDAKRINFGFAYYMGASAMHRKFNWPMEKAIEFMELYKSTFPFIVDTRNHVVKVARGRGYIRTILGRRSRISEKLRREKREYSMFNRLIQGTAADINKKSMLDAYNAGVFDVVRPEITVHDELDGNVPKTVEGIEAYRELKEIMENAVKLRVPIVAEAEIGSSWGDGASFEWNDLYKSIE